MQDTQDMRGKVRLLAQTADGRIVFDRWHANRIVRSGREMVAQRFAGVPGTPPAIVSHMAVGTGFTPTSDDDVKLNQERTRVAVLQPVVYTAVEEAGTKRIKVSLQAVFDFADANGPEPLREAGIFTADKDGTLYNRVVFDPVTKADTFKLTLMWDILF